jgi:hypothetical protein
MMRDKIAEIIKNIKDVESRPDYIMPYQVADQILALEVPGKVVFYCPPTLTECPYAQSLGTTCDGCEHVLTRPATIADLIKGEE